MSYPGRNIYIKEVSTLPENIKQVKNLEGKNLKNETEIIREKTSADEEKILEESKRAKPVKVKNNKY